jgi:molybdopterin synthase sulfur carrier subunit
VSVKIVLPTALARHTDGQKNFASDAKNLPGLIAEIGEKFPALAANVKDENGKLRKFINVYVNDEDIRFLGGDSHEFADGDEVMLIPSIAGGAPSPLPPYFLCKVLES